MRRLLIEALERGNPALPVVIEGDPGDRALWDAAGVANRATFEDDAVGWYIVERACTGNYRVVRRRGPALQRWEPPRDDDPFPATSIEEAVDCMTDLLRFRTSRTMSLRPSMP